MPAYRVVDRVLAQARAPDPGLHGNAPDCNSSLRTRCCKQSHQVDKAIRTSLSQDLAAGPHVGRIRASQEREVPTVSVARIKSDFRNLTRDDKIQLVQELWDEIADRDAAFVLTAEQEAELDARYQRYLADPSIAIPLNEVMARFEREK